MAKDDTMKNIEAGKGIPPLSTPAPNNGNRQETRELQGLKLVTFSAYSQNTSSGKK